MIKSLAQENQEMRYRAALKAKDVPDHIIWMFDGPILFQLGHLCCVIDQPMHWKDALRWCHDHRDEIIEHARKSEIIKHEQRVDAAAKANGEAHRNDAISDDQG